MKHYIFFFITTCCITANAQTLHPFNLSCTVHPELKGYIYLSYSHNGEWKKDSSMVTGGKALFKGMLPYPAFARLEHDQKEKQLFLEAGNMTFSSADEDISTGIVSGSKTQKEFDELNSGISIIKDRWKIVWDTLLAINKRSNKTFQEYRGWVLVPFFKELEEANINFFSKYPASYAAAFTLQLEARNLTTDSVRLFYDRFPARLKQSEYGRNIFEQLEKRKLGAVGTTAADFSKPDINGNMFNLADLRGKYVLLDFWGSWCVPCRKSHPHLKELYAKYKEQGFEIVGIAADDRTPDAWRKAVKEDDLPWLQVLEGDPSGNNIGKQYDIMFYPTKILIDKNGKIIGRYTEEHEILEKKLENLFR